MGPIGRWHRNPTSSIRRCTADAIAWSPRRSAEARRRRFRRLAMSAIAVHHTETDDGAWDGPANEARLKVDAGEVYYKSAFAWQDPDGDPETKAAYKFPHHLVDEDGNVGAANGKACQTGCGVLNGGMGGAKIPDADRQGVSNHLAAPL